jgi:methionyl-tRNA formyltransferase
MQPRLLVFCTLSTGLDAIAEILRKNCEIEALVGLHPDVANSTVSGYVDISKFCEKWNVKYYYAHSYSLSDPRDKEFLSSLNFELLWVFGWQRLIPRWLIDLAPYGVLGVHGSPDGISAGRGRSPQNWAIIFGSQRFELAVFRISAGIDDGPIILERTFIYGENDDIGISYKKAALCSAEMLINILKKPELIHQAVSQHASASYYPQRRAEDGYVDWTLSCREIYALCRALTRPYPGLRSKSESDLELKIWRCLPFDDRVIDRPGTVSIVFEDKSFLVQARDGRLLVLDYEFGDNGDVAEDIYLISKDFRKTITDIVDRHIAKSPEMMISRRILNLLPQGGLDDKEGVTISHSQK